MTQKSKLDRLTGLSKLILDQYLTQLQASAAARQASLKQLQDLVPNPADDLDLVTNAKAAIRYEHWADTKRRDINIVLARQTATWLEARLATQTAFGRADVLQRLMRKMTK
jgi:hypothetical protein